MLHFTQNYILPCPVWLKKLVKEIENFVKGFKRVLDKQFIPLI